MRRRHRCPPRYGAAHALHKSRVPSSYYAASATRPPHLYAVAVYSSNNIKPQFNAQFIIARARAGIFRATAAAAADHCFDYLWHRTERSALHRERAISRQTTTSRSRAREPTPMLTRRSKRAAATACCCLRPTPSSSNKYLVSFYS